LLARSQRSDSLSMDQFAGLGSRQPLLAVSLTIIMLALTGLPPTVGFTAKLLSFSALFDAYQRSSNPWLLTLFGLGLLNALISLVYYVRIPFLLFFRPAPADLTTPASLPRFATGLSVALALITLLLFLRPDLLTNWIANL